MDGANFALRMSSGGKTRRRSGRWCRAAGAVVTAGLLLTACSGSLPFTGGSPTQTGYQYVEEDADAWAKDVFDGATSAANEAGDFHYDVETQRFGWDRSGDDDVLEYSSDDVRARYEDEPLTIDGPVVLAYWRDDEIHVYDTGRPDHLTPRYYPTHENGWSLLDNLDPDQFANRLHEAEYLIISGGFESHRNVGHYLGGVDRVVITTMVLVLDVQARRFVHIENLGTDAPNYTRTDHATGYVKADEANTYLRSILKTTATALPAPSATPS